MAADGSDVRQVTDDPVDKWRPEWAFNGTQLAWSPDGQQLLYVAEGVEGGTDLWMIAAEGGRPQNLTAAPGDDFQPNWCHNGTIYFASTRTNRIPQIFLTTLEAVAQGERPVNFSATHNSPREWDPAPYPDCERLMFVSSLGGANEIWRFWPDCSSCLSRVRSLRTLGGQAEEPALSPDGRWLAYTQVRESGAELALANVGDDSGQPLTAGQGGFSAQWSPDGQWLAFVSERDGNREIYLMNRAGGEQRNLSQSAAADMDPAWQPGP
jgi:Tol biopolymer transport system component